MSLPNYKRLIICNVEEYKSSFLEKYYMLINKIQNRPHLNQEDIVRLARLGFNLNSQFINTKLLGEYFVPINPDKSNILVSISKQYIRKTYRSINTYFLNEVFMYTLLLKYGIESLAPKLIEVGFNEMTSQYYITMEYIPNEYSLGKFSIYDLLDFVFKVNKLHILGITHNDIKPDNIVLNGNVNLIDFEYCKVTYPFKTKDLFCMSKYTPLYAPLEKLQIPSYIKYDIGYSDDLWSIGITILEVYIGVDIFKECRCISELKQAIRTKITKENIKNNILPDDPELCELITSILLDRIDTKEIIKRVIRLICH